MCLDAGGVSTPHERRPICGGETPPADHRDFNSTDLLGNRPSLAIGASNKKTRRPKPTGGERWSCGTTHRICSVHQWWVVNGRAGRRRGVVVGLVREVESAGSSIVVF